MTLAKQQVHGRKANHSGEQLPARFFDLTMLCTCIEPLTHWDQRKAITLNAQAPYVITMYISRLRKANSDLVETLAVSCTQFVSAPPALLLLTPHFSFSTDFRTATYAPAVCNTAAATFPAGPASHTAESPPIVFDVDDVEVFGLGTAVEFKGKELPGRAPLTRLWAGDATALSKQRYGWELDARDADRRTGLNVKAAGGSEAARKLLELAGWCLPFI
ncbi:hypothetical protein HDU89_001707 [Geranomyces variabilis]|nr:hypothetical protein HDU89_001707 [Geranomyces variabilis]